MINLNKIIAIGSDHAGYELKNEIISFLTTKGYKTKDFGCYSNASIDYPDYGHPVATYVEEEQSYGIVICGSGNGINMTVNKHAKIRGALCWEIEIAELARQHNNANVLTLPARFLSVHKALEIVDKFFSTSFEEGRHLTRINKIPCA